MLPEIDVKSANRWFFDEWARIKESGDIDAIKRHYELLVHDRFNVEQAIGGYSMSEADSRCPNISPTVGSGDGRIVRKRLRA